MQLSTSTCLFCTICAEDSEYMHVLFLGTLRSSGFPVHARSAPWDFAYLKYQVLIIGTLGYLKEFPSYPRHSRVTNKNTPQLPKGIPDLPKAFPSYPRHSRVTPGIPELPKMHFRVTQKAFPSYPSHSRVTQHTHEPLHCPMMKIDNGCARS